MTGILTLPPRNPRPGLRTPACPTRGRPERRRSLMPPPPRTLSSNRLAAAHLTRAHKPTKSNMRTRTRLRYRARPRRATTASNQRRRRRRRSQTGRPGTTLTITTKYTAANSLSAPICRGVPTRARRPPPAAACLPVPATPRRCRPVRRPPRLRLPSFPAPRPRPCLPSSRTRPTTPTTPRRRRLPPACRPSTSRRTRQPSRSRLLLRDLLLALRACTASAAAVVAIQEGVEEVAEEAEREGQLLTVSRHGYPRLTRPRTTTFSETTTSPCRQRTASLRPLPTATARVTGLPSGCRAEGRASRASERGRSRRPFRRRNQPASGTRRR